MLRKLGHHLRVNAVAYLALVVATGGTSAYAADRIGAEDIKRNAVLSKHIINAGVKLRDIAPAAQGIRNAEVVFETSALTGDEDSKSVGVECPDGKFAISGGAFINASDDNVYITESSPQSGGPGPLQNNWFILAQEEEGTDGGNWDIRGFAVCVTVDP